jgi:uncharacterized protein (DUF1501 family)
MPASPKTRLLLRNDEAWPTGHDATLVVVFLRGGADTLSLLPPYGDDRYFQSRPTLAVPPPGRGNRSAIRLDDHYGLHPDMAALEPAYRDGRLAFVQAVGIDNTSGSHFECQDQMEHGSSPTTAPVSGGWLGRFLRTIDGDQLGPLPAVAIGKSLPESLRGGPASVLERLDEVAVQGSATDLPLITQTLASLYGAEQNPLGRQGLQTLDLFRRVASLPPTTATTRRTATYPDNTFAAGLRQIAELIRAGIGLRVACLDLPGWDTHFFQGATDGQQAALVDRLAKGLAAFETDMSSCRQRVTVLVTTEFGRRVYENASQGTDHGRGFAAMLLGNSVAGGQVHGHWPLEEIADPTPSGPGGLGIERDARALFAEVLQHVFAADKAALHQVFPGLKSQQTGLFRSSPSKS